MPTKAVKPPEKETEQSESVPPPLAVMEAIELQFTGRSGKLKCSLLWEKNGVRRYRVNWWDDTTGSAKVKSSAFVHVYAAGNGDLIVEDRSKNGKRS